MAITKEEILSKCSSELIASRDCQAIAAKVSEGRKRASKREIGNGTILETIGFVKGNALLDEINNNPNYRYVKPLVAEGRLLIGSPFVQYALRAMTPDIVSSEDVAKLSALGFEDDSITAFEVAGILFNVDGSVK